MDYYFNLPSCAAVIRCSTSPGAGRMREAWLSQECWESDDNFTLKGNKSRCLFGIACESLDPLFILPDVRFQCAVSDSCVFRN